VESRRYCEDDVPRTLRRLYNPTVPADNDTLTGEYNLRDDDA